MVFSHVFETEAGTIKVSGVEVCYYGAVESILQVRIFVSDWENFEILKSTSFLFFSKNNFKINFNINFKSKKKQYYFYNIRVVSIFVKKN